MLVSDAIPRQIDTVGTLGVDAAKVARACSRQLMVDHPELELDGVELELSTARLLESLAISVQTNDDGPFKNHCQWMLVAYSARDIPRHLVEDQLLQLRRLLRNSLRRSVAHRVGEIIDRTVLGLQERADEAPHVISDTLMALTADRLIAELLRGDRDRALAVMEEGIGSGLKVLDCYVGVIQPAMHAIGRMWQERRISVTQEHVATALLPAVMARCRTHFRGRPARRGTLVLTGVEGELHEMGLRVVGDVAEADGWETRYLGTNAPSTDTIDYMRNLPAEIIGITVTMPHNLEAATAMVEFIRSDRVLRSASVFVGGQAAFFNQEVWARLGAICEKDLDAGRFVSLAREQGL